MNTVRALQGDGDIVTSGQHFIRDKDAVAQNIKTRLSLFYGEYFRDITEGTPWYQLLLLKTVELPTKEAVLREIILRTQDVASILKFETAFDIDSRQYTVTCAVMTTYGLIEFEQTGG